MKPSRMFWGMLFISAGSCFLLQSFGAEVRWMSVWRFWPLVIVLLGLALMVRHVVLRALIAAITGLWVGWLIFFVTSLSWLDAIVDAKVDSDTSEVQQIFEPLPDNLHKAVFHLEAAAAKLSVDTAVGHLLAARIGSRLGKFEVKRSMRDGIPHIQLVQTRSLRVGWFEEGTEMRSGVIALSPRPSWDMRFELAASSAELDLRPFRIQNFSLEADASSVRLWMGAPEKEMHCNIKGRVATLRISVPESVGCEIRMSTQGGLSSKRFEGFRKVRDRLYATDGYATSDRKMVLDLDVGLSTLRVERY